jgi:hypothetical protein
MGIPGLRHHRVPGMARAWCAEERRRMQNVDLGTTQYLGLPYYGRWLLSAARILVDGHHVTLTELINKIDEVKKRHESR